MRRELRLVASGCAAILKVPMLPTQSSQFEHAALKNYLLDHAYDEMFSGPGDLHRHCEPLLEHFTSLPVEELQRRKQAADLSCNGGSRQPTSAS